MSVPSTIIRAIDWFYPPFRKLIAKQTFRYAACGGGNLFLNWVLYWVVYNFIIDKQYWDLGLIVISPHTLALLIVFPITFFTGFWLNRHVVFRSSPLRDGTQLMRYLLSVIGSFALDYVFLQIFVELCHIYPTPSQILASLITVIYSYIMQYYFSFRGHSKE